MTISHREAMLAVLTLSVALFGGSALFARSRLDRWRQLKAEQFRVRADLEGDKALIAERERWEEEFAELSKMLRAHPANKKMDVHWLAVMDQLASKHGVRIAKRRVGEEKQEGDVFELPIEVEHEGWQASLESLVGFLLDLQTEGAMLDIRQLRITPKPGGTLSGRFSLYCAYRRENAGQNANDTEMKP